MKTKANKRKQKKTKFVRVRFFLAGILILLFVNFISAINIGVSPASISFKDVLRGGYAERTVIISADSDLPVTVNLKPRGDIEDWFIFEEEEFTVSKDEPYSLKVSVLPPSDIPNGGYTGFLRIEVGGSTESIEEHAVGTVKSSLDLAVSIEVTDIEITKCVASNLEIISAEKGDDIILKMKVANGGNIRLKPTVELDIWDFDKISIIDEEDFLGNEILPSTEKELEFRFNSKDFEIGQYWSDAFVTECFYSQVLTFDVMEPGTLSARGILLNILTKGTVEVGETSLMIVNFKNTGEKEIDAQFRGEVTKNGKIIDILESPLSKVPVNSVEEFNFYFTPKSEGKYIVNGRVYYEGKKTFELSSVLEAIEKNGFSLIWGVYVMFIFVIGFLFYRIRREKKIYLDKLRRIK
ncbi:MAG: hypothetical protein PVJ67_03045 [Candidatus Pacearchaeota archaeon]|jgi:hypothetical protein